MRKLLFYVLVLCFACPLMAKQPSGGYSPPDLDEFRIELDDLKQALKAAQVDLNLLDERCRKQDRALTQNKEPNPAALFSSQINGMEKRIAQLEKTLEKASNDLRSLNMAATQTSAKLQELEKSLLSHEKRLDDVVKLKGTLTNISKAIGQRPQETAASTKIYRVKAGDSLEKIARNNHLSVETLKKLNQLSSDKIVIGQELRLADEP